MFISKIKYLLNEGMSAKVLVTHCIQIVFLLPVCRVYTPLSRKQLAGDSLNGTFSMDFVLSAKITKDQQNSMRHMSKTS